MKDSDIQVDLNVEVRGDLIIIAGRSFANMRLMLALALISIKPS